MPEGARLRKDASQTLAVVDHGAAIATIPNPTAVDAEGDSVPVSMSVSGHIVTITVGQLAGRYRMPIAVDPSIEGRGYVEDSGFGYAPYSSAWYFNRCEGCTAFTAQARPEGGKWTENIAGKHSATEWGGLFYTTKGESQIVEASVEGSWNDENAGIQNYAVLYAEKPEPHTESYSVLPVKTQPREEGGTVCAPEKNCPGTIAAGVPSNENTAAYQQLSTKAVEGPGWTNTLTKARVVITQKALPEVHFNTTSPTIQNSQTGENVSNVLYGGGESWLGPHHGAFEVNAKDPGMGLTLYRLLGAGEFDYRDFYAGWEPYRGAGPQCFGVQCPKEVNQGYVYQTGLYEGEPVMETLVKNATEAIDYIYPQKIKVDASPPHGIKVNGLQNGDELPLGESRLKIEATDGTAPTPSSGVKSIGLRVDGQEVAGTAAACPVGPCTATGEATLAARDYASGLHAVIVTATDNAGNVIEEEFTFRVHGANPVSVGPGSVDPSTGQLTLAATDVSPGGLTGVSRTYQSRETNAGAEGPLGPQWTINLGGDESLTVQLDGSAVLAASGGAHTTFARKDNGEFESPTGDSNLKLEAKEKEVGKGVSEYVLKNERAGTQTKFEQPTGAQSTTPTVVNQFGAEAGQLDHPVSDAIDAGGNVWSVNYQSDLVEKYSSTGALESTYGSQGTAGGQYIAPWGIAIDQRNGNVYVTDQGNSRVQELSSSGTFIRTFGWGVKDGKAEFEICATECKSGIAGAGNGQFSSVAGLGVDASGNVWVADFGNNRIQEFNEKGEYVKQFGASGTEAGRFEGPLNVAFSGGNVYVTDFRNNRVQEFSTAGTFLAKFGESGSGSGQFIHPWGIASDPSSGNLYVVDSGNARVEEFTATGAYITRFGSAGKEPGQFLSAQGVAVNASGSVYVVDDGGNRVEEWMRATWVPTEAGGALSGSTTTYAYKTVEQEGRAVVEPTEALAPIPIGVSSCSPLTRGCRALTFNYSESTTAAGEKQGEWGDYKGHLTRVYFHAWDPAKAAMTETTVAQYAYDQQGRLRAEWDPRISPALKTIYGYDAGGHVTALSPPGQQPWALTYGTIAGSASPGRLLKVMRPSATTPLWNGAGVPNNTTKPNLTGSPGLGVRLGISHGSWTNSPVAFGYQWLDCNAQGKDCTPIAGATNPNYTIGTSDLGHIVGVTETATNGGGSGSVTALMSAVAAGVSTEYGLPSGSGPGGVAQGPDGNTWFTDSRSNKIGKITPAGAVTEYPLPAESAPEDITRGPDGNLWFTDWGTGKVGKITTSGAITEYAVFPYAPAGITTGPDGNLWFTEYYGEVIEKITTAGVVTLYGLPVHGTGALGITSGPDGNLWFTAHGNGGFTGGNGHAIGKMSTQGDVTEYQLPANSGPNGVAVGADGNLWFTDETTSKIGKITTSGAVTEYALPSGSAPLEITRGPDENMWFTDVHSSKIGKITTSGTISEYALPERSEPVGITAGSDGNLWYADYATNKIGKSPTSGGTVREEGAGHGPEPGTTVEYGVPVSGNGAPYALGSKEAEEWGQKDDPVEGVAIFRPDEPTGWPASSYKSATVHYWDAEGRLVNTALPTGGIATSEYNETNDVVRSLSADNREAALKEGGNSAQASQLLDTESTYNANGTRLLETRGPQRKVKLASGPEVVARDHTKYFYDEGAPSGGLFGLLTKQTDGAEYEGKEADVRTTVTSYSGQSNLGWKLRKPTSVTTDPGGLDLTRTTVYDASTGNALETTSPAGSATDPIPSYSLAFGGVGNGEGQFEAPWGVAVNQKTGNVYVTASATSRIEEFSASGKFIAWVGSSGTGTGQMSKPEAIAIDSSGNVWVGDAGNERIDEFNEKGEFVRSFGAKGSGEGQFAGAIDGITLNASHVWVSDTNNNRVEKFSLTGTPEGSFGTFGSGNGQFQAPTGIVFAGSHLYVDDYANHRIEEFSTAGKYITQFGGLGTGNGQIESPVGIAADPQSGDLYVSDYGSSRVEEFTSAGVFVAWLGYSGAGNGQFSHPDGLATSASGSLYVVDSANTRVSAWEAGYSGAHTSRTIFYSVKANSKYPTCGKHAEWANLPCQTQPLAQPSTAGLPSLPVSTMTYNVWGEPETSIESFGSTTRATKLTYDPAGRALSHEVTSSADAPLSRVTNARNAETGALETQSIISGGVTKTITSMLNRLGQLEQYTDADGVTSTYSYDVDGRVQELNYGTVDGQTAGQIYSYSATTGLITKLVDSAVGTFKAAYDAEGSISSENYPNGMKATYTRDQAGDATGIEYKKTSNCGSNCVWFNNTITPTIHGETLKQSSTLAEEPSYTYDAAGRLTDVQEVPAGKGCTTRSYAYDEEGNRTSLTTRDPGSNGECTGAGGTSERHTYDAANRLNDSGTSYDAFGNTTTLPAADAGGHELKSSYYVDGQVASQEQDGKTISYLYDPAGRRRETLATGTQPAISHYAAPGEALTWTTEGERWTRNIPGIDGGLCAIQTAGQAPVLQLHDLQGNVVATAALSESETKLLSTYNSTEFGVPQTGSAAPKYAWLGASGLSTELPTSGVVTTSAGSYVPEIGRTLQTGPIASPAAFPDGTGGVGIIEASYIAALAEQMKAIAVEHEAALEAAARQEAEERARLEECPPTACGPWPDEGGAEGAEEDPTGILWWKAAEDRAGLFRGWAHEVADAAEKFHWDIGSGIAALLYDKAEAAESAADWLESCARTVKGFKPHGVCWLSYTHHKQNILFVGVFDILDTFDVQACTWKSGHTPKHEWFSCPGHGSWAG